MTFIDKALASLVAAGLLLASAIGPAQAQSALQANREYVRLDPPQPVASGDRIEVIEFFYYGCPVCYELEPMLTRWSVEAPGDIVLRRVPALASASWENFARLYYALETLGEVTRLHWPIYEGFHFDDISLSEEPVMLEWVSRNGVDAQKFLDAYRSPAIQAKVTEAREMIRTYGVKGVPSIAVDGKFLTSARMAGGTRELMPVLDSLIELARKARAK
jgi:thiol:disulfide interchange protein DsbA